MKIKDERWRVIKGFEDYEVSDWGNVRSLNYNRSGKVKLLKPGNNGLGYCFVELCKAGKSKQFLVHRLVVTAFIGPIPKGMVVNHLNEIKNDNRLSNLEICTVTQNNNHGTRNERAGKANSKALLGNTNRAKQLDLIEADWPYRELTFKNSYIASEFFGYKNESQVSTNISQARKRGKNFINLKGTKYFFNQEA